MVVPICPICDFTAIGKSYRKSNWQYYFCPECKTYFLFPAPSGEALSEFYKNHYRNQVAAANEKNIRKRSRKVIGQLLKINPRGRSLLDIGSGFGFFADEAKQKNLKVTAVEPSKFLSQNSSAKLGIRTLNMTFEKFHQTYQEEKFDFITLIHVIEHVGDPQAFLEMIFSHLDKNGLLYIETPNSDSYLFKSEKQDYVFLTPPDHIWIFSSTGFKAMFKTDRQFIHKVSTYSDPSHLMGILKRILKPTKIRTYKKPSAEIPIYRYIRNNLSKKFKYMVFDLFLARIFCGILNPGNHGSYLEIYIKKIS